MTLIRMLSLKFAIKPHWPSKFNMKLGYTLQDCKKNCPTFNRKAIFL